MHTRAAYSCDPAPAMCAGEDWGDARPVSQPLDPYEVLQVASTADDTVVRAAYRALAQRYHPDVAGPGGEFRMRELNAAWEVIGDPEHRAAYDLARAASGTRRSPATTVGTDRPAGVRPTRTSLPVRHRHARRHPGRELPARRPDVRRAASWTSVSTTAGRSARSPATMAGISSGWRRSPRAGPTPRRSTRSCGASGCAERRRPIRPAPVDEGAGSSDARDRSRSDPESRRGMGSWRGTTNFREVLSRGRRPPAIRLRLRPGVPLCAARRYPSLHVVVSSATSKVRLEPTPPSLLRRVQDTTRNAHGRSESDRPERRGCGERRDI